MLQLTVIPPVSPDNEQLSVASDTGGRSCQCNKHDEDHYRDLGNRVRIGEIRNDPSWWWQPTNLRRSTGGLF